MSFRRKRRVRRALGAALGILLLCLAAAEMWMYPLLLSYGGHTAEAWAVAAVNETVAAVLAETQTAYGDLTTVTRDAEGRIVTLQTDAARLNRLQSEIAVRLSERIGETSRGRFTVPFGTVCGGALLSGRGPDVTFFAAVDGVAKTELRDEFSAAGINQTYHRVYLDITLQVLVTVMGHREVREVAVPAVMAQTVLMGTVPETYWNWHGDT